MKAWLTL